MWDGLIVLGILGLLVAAEVISRRFQPKKGRCPVCRERRLEQLSKESLGLLEGNFGSGKGGHSTISVRYRASYRCANCGATWRADITETG